MGETVVKVFIYDLTKGLARSMSLPLLGKQLDGVWHTGIVAFGQEFFYGGDGISSCPPCGTIMGQPDQVVQLGITEIPMEMFMEYLNDLSTSAYSPARYHLLSHNCNTFSNDVANFLTGNNIPSYVTDLPQEVLNTPFGAMIRPFIDAISVSPGGGQELFPASSGAGAGAVKTQSSTGKDAGKGHSAAGGSTSKDKPTTASTGAGAASKSTSAPTSDTAENMKCYNNKEILDKYKQSKEGLLQQLNNEDRKLLEEMHEYLLTPNCDWSLGPHHVHLLGRVLESSSTGAQERQLLSALLQQACMNEDVVVMLKYDHQSTVFRIILQMSAYDIEAQASLLKAVCNMCSHPMGLELLSDTSDKTLDKRSTTHRKVTLDACVACILHDSDQLNSVGAALACNLMQAKVREELAMELGIALAQLCSKPLPDDTADCALCALWKCMQVDQEVTSVAAVMGLELSVYQNKSGQLQETSAKIARALQTSQ